jgi:hypothetical protein
MRLGEPFKNKFYSAFAGDVHIREKSVYDNQITNVRTTWTCGFPLAIESLDEGSAGITHAGL